MTGQSRPRWFTAHQIVTRLVHRSATAAYIITDELLGVLAKPAQRDQITIATYADATWYAMDWTSRVEFFPWESRAVSALGVTKGSTVLLGAAGGGREMEALARKDARVLAFEPTDLFDSARTIAAKHDGSRVWRADYADLVRVADSGDGPLRELADEKVDVVILGWGSIGHILDPSDQLALLRATRKLAPDAPLLCSYLGEITPGGGRRARVRAQLRRLRPTTEPRVHFRGDVGFYYAFHPREIGDLAAQAGYRLDIEDWDDFPFAILRPVELERG